MELTWDILSSHFEDISLSFLNIAASFLIFCDSFSVFLYIVFHLLFH